MSEVWRSRSLDVGDHASPSADAIEFDVEAFGADEIEPPHDRAEGRPSRSPALGDTAAMPFIHIDDVDCPGQ